MFRILPIAVTFLLVGCQTQPQVQVPNEPEGVVGEVMKWEKKCQYSNYTVNDGTYTFHPFENKKNIKGGCGNNSTNLQRSEIQHKGARVPFTTTDKFVFTSKWSITTDSPFTFTMFQIHDEKEAGGCKPELMLESSEGMTEFVGQWKFDWDGERALCNSKAMRDRFAAEDEEANRAKTDFTFKRDGTIYDIRVEVDFVGNGDFKATLFVDGEEKLVGYYNYPTSDEYLHPKTFGIHHGNYSAYMFDYEIISRDVKLYRIRR